MNDLTDALGRGEVWVELENIVKFLERYVHVHFETEEKYMQKYNYPGYGMHKREHQQFLKDFNNLKNEFKTKGISTKLATQIHRQVIQWYLKHINHIDKSMGKFLRNKVWKKTV